MTTAKTGPSNVVVVDGSNIATEGRSLPSLGQLNDAVMAFMEEFPNQTVTVVVDATFGHRIEKREAAEFDAAIANNELVAPPAGAIGRGDAFVLTIANKVGARILSNDSFQEFHGDYPWLFDEGRLIGGKPVLNVGWVFVERLPVKGAVSRKAQRAARSPSTTRSRRSASPEASMPMPVPSAPPPAPRKRSTSRQAAASTATALAEHAVAPAPAASTGTGVNELLPFLDFVEHHPIGSSVNGVVESYSSHGAYVSVGDVRGYVPLRLMSVPPPRSAREVMKVGDAVTLVVTSFAPARRSIDLAVPNVAPDAPAELPPPPPELEGITAGAESVAIPTKRRASAATARKRAATTTTPTTKAAPTRKKQAAEATSTKKQAAAKRTRSATTPVAAPEATSTPAKRSSKRAAPAGAAPVKAAAKQAAPTRRKQAAAPEAAPAKRATKKQDATKQPAAAKRTSAKRTSAKRTTAAADAT